MIYLILTVAALSCILATIQLVSEERQWHHFISTLEE